MNYCWAALSNAVFTTKQMQLLKRGSYWMTPLGGAQSKVNIIYICIFCTPHPQGAVESNGWYITTSGIVADPSTGKLTKLAHPRWKCPLCGAMYSLVTGARALAIDGRESSEDTGDIIVFPLAYHKIWESTHPDYELDKQVESLIDWLRMVPLMDQLSAVDANTIRAAIERTNDMVVNRVKASRSWSKSGSKSTSTSS